MTQEESAVSRQVWDREYGYFQSLRGGDLFACQALVSLAEPPAAQEATPRIRVDQRGTFAAIITMIVDLMLNADVVRLAQWQCTGSYRNACFSPAPHTPSRPGVLVPIADGLQLAGGKDD